MNIVAQVFALLTSVIHVAFFVWESALFGRRSVHKGVFGVPADDVPAVRQWAFNVGFYNLFLAAGPLIGVIAHYAGNDVVARTLVLYSCSFAVLAGVALVLSDWVAKDRPKGASVRGALVQSVPALVAVVAVLV